MKYLVLIILVFGISCSKIENKTNSKKIYIQCDSLQSVIDIGAFVENIEITPLKEERGAYIGEAHKVLKTKDHYIVFDKSITKRIVVFDTVGGFVKNVITLGRGPGEAIQLNDCWINNEGNLEIYDFALKKVFTCNRDFDIVKETKTSKFIFSALSRIPKSNSFAGFKNYSSYNPEHEGKRYQVAILDNSLKSIEDTDLFYNDELDGISIIESSNPFQKINDTLRFSNYLNPFIYDISVNNNFVKRFELVYSPNPFPVDYEESILLDNRGVLKFSPGTLKTKDITEGYNGYAGIWMETNDYVIIGSFNSKYERFYSLLRKTDNQIMVQSKQFSVSKNLFKRLPDFMVSEVEENSFTALVPGIHLEYILNDDHPIMKNRSDYLDKNFIIKVKLKRI
ncbi:6-bladed beta-propeller [Aestuariibaculum sediminum]|uniref:6-bladed beta-propeller n=1 Tax=Aestuariibaculum sediminum TaxID=2770637 RepID=A0A8J6Q4I6_9FLAO|nr:6-bladed beta-propeller [Aestuariibaculum sediminum]MBD0833725.1 6-bladed beta-propeller [Aestuariibaculum sediminum]